MFIATSVDGYIAGPGGELDWLEPMQASGDDYGFEAFFGAVDALVMGRRTYDTAIGFPRWPYSGKRVYVVTNRPVEPRHGERPVSGAPAGVLARVEAKHVYVDGGVVIRQFLAANLIGDPDDLGRPDDPGRGDPPVRGRRARSPARARRLAGMEDRARAAALPAARASA